MVLTNLCLKHHIEELRLHARDFERVSLSPVECVACKK